MAVLLLLMLMFFLPYVRQFSIYIAVHITNNSSPVSVKLAEEFNEPINATIAQKYSNSFRVATNGSKAGPVSEEAAGFYAASLQDLTPTSIHSVNNLVALTFTEFSRRS